MKIQIATALAGILLLATANCYSYNGRPEIPQAQVDSIVRGKTQRAKVESLLRLNGYAIKDRIGTTDKGEVAQTYSGCKYAASKLYFIPVIGPLIASPPKLGPCTSILVVYDSAGVVRGTVITRTDDVNSKSTYDIPGGKLKLTFPLRR